MRRIELECHAVHGGHGHLPASKIVERIEKVRDPQGTVAQRIPSAGESTVCTSIVVAAELRFGAKKSGSSKLADRIGLILSALDILPLEAPADRHYGEVRQQLVSQGTPIGPNDRRCCMIQLRREWGRFSNSSFRTPQRKISAYPARPSSYALGR